MSFHKWHLYGFVSIAGILTDCCYVLGPLVQSRYSLEISGQCDVSRGPQKWPVDALRLVLHEARQGLCPQARVPQSRCRAEPSRWEASHLLGSEDKTRRVRGLREAAPGGCSCTVLGTRSRSVAPVVNPIFP